MAVKKVAKKTTGKKVTHSASSVRAAKSPKVAKRTVLKPSVVKKTAVSKETKVPKVAHVTSSLSVALFDNVGKEKGTVKLPEAIFGVKVNKPLLAQAVRVYLANQRMGSAVTKTRGQVDGSTRKIYRQKGTGRARHGGIRAPIFVGGGIAHGPKLRDYSLNLSAKMRKAALLSALSALAAQGQVKVIVGLDALEPKTKLVAKTFAAMELQNKKMLLLMPEYMEKVFRSTRNIDKITVSMVQTLTTYEVLNAGTLVIMQEALSKMETFFVNLKSQDTSSKKNKNTK